MNRRMIGYLMTGLLCAASGFAQSGAEPTPGATDIRKVDFLNFTHHSSLCSREYGSEAIGSTVRTRNGELKSGDVFFEVAADRIVYADRTGDGREEAIVPVDCGAVGANFVLSEIHVYPIRKGRTTFLAGLSDKDLERDYRHSHPDAESYWGVAEHGVNVKDGDLQIEVLADGPHAAPEHLVTLDYCLR